MKNRILIFAFVSLFSSCKEKNEELKNVSNKNKANDEEVVLENYKNINKDTLVYQDENLISKSDFITHGDGVVNLNISNELFIYNKDNSIFGKIIFSEESESYILEMPKEINARYFVPVLDQFYFDAENPNKDETYLNIFINSKIKKVKKDNVNFNFVTWQNYLKENFIKIRKLDSKDLDKNTYEVLNIEEDSILIKSVSKKACDAIETYTNVSKKIKWRDNNLLLIDFFECN